MIFNLTMIFKNMINQFKSEYDDLSDLENDAKGELKHHDAKHISMNLGDKMRMERQSIRHNFLAYEHGKLHGSICVSNHYIYVLIFFYSSKLPRAKIQHG